MTTLFRVGLCTLVLALGAGISIAQPPLELPSGDRSGPSTSKPTPKPTTAGQRDELARKAILEAMKNPNAVLAEFLLNAPPDVAEKGKAAKEDFEAKRAALKDSIIEMRVLHTRFLNEENNSDSDADAYRVHRNQVRKLMVETLDSAIEVFRYMPDRLAAQFILTSIEYREPRDIYDQRTLDGALQMIRVNSPYAYVYVAAARSAVTVGDFEIAERLYEGLDEKVLTEMDQALIQQMETLKKQWEDESERRKQDEKKELPLVKLETSRGDLLIELYIDEAPSTVAHFIRHVEDGFYDGLTFFQVIEGMLALTGDPSGDGSGVPEKFLLDEHTRETVRSPLRGSLVMAKMPIPGTSDFVPNSAGTQFAILYMPFTHVISQQTVFGRVIEGMEVVGDFRLVDPHEKKKKTDIVLPPERIIKATVVRRPDELPESQYVDTPGPAIPAMMPIAP